MKALRVYISGAITGRASMEYMSQFADARKKLFQNGYEVVDPANTCYGLPDTFTHDDYMDICMVLLRKCDAIYMLDGWRDSVGANRELNYAREHGYILMGEIEGVTPITSKFKQGDTVTISNDYVGRFGRGTIAEVIKVLPKRIDDKNVCICPRESHIIDWYREEDLKPYE